MNNTAWIRILNWLTTKGVDDASLEAAGAAVVIASNLVWYVLLCLKRSGGRN